DRPDAHLPHRDGGRVGYGDQDDDIPRRGASARRADAHLARADRAYRREDARLQAVLGDARRRARDDARHVSEARVMERRRLADARQFKTDKLATKNLVPPKLHIYNVSL